MHWVRVDVDATLAAGDVFGVAVPTGARLVPFPFDPLTAGNRLYVFLCAGLSGVVAGTDGEATAGSDPLPSAPAFASATAVVILAPCRCRARTRPACGLRGSSPKSNCSIAGSTGESVRSHAAGPSCCGGGGAGICGLCSGEGSRV